MGIREILTKPIKFGSWEFHWHEPRLYRLRLQGDLLYRLVIVLAAWLGGTGVMLLVFAWNVNRPSAALAAGLGALFGMAPAFLFLFARRNQVSGSVWVYDDHILRQAASVGIGYLLHSHSEWFFNRRTRCRIVTADRLDQPFHVMLIESEGVWDIVGIPRKIELKQLAAYLTGQGLEVTSGRSVPAEFCMGLQPATSAIASVVGVIFLLGGAFLYLHEHDAAGGQPARPERLVADRGRPSEPAVRLPPDDRRPATQQPQADPTTKTEPMADNTPGQSADNRPLDILSRPPVVPNRRAQDSTNPKPGINSSTETGTLAPLVGGEGGFPFRIASPQNQAVIGVRYSFGAWGGKQRVGKLEPLFARDDPGRPWQAQWAREGYVLGGLQVDAPEFIDAVAPIYMRLESDGTLNPDDSYLGDWIGERSNQEPQIASGAGAKVIGLHGRGGAVMDAIGLILQKVN